MFLKETQYVMTEIHKRVYGNHSSGRTFARQALRVGFSWPRALKDVKEFMRKCERCQEHEPVSHCPPEEMTSITSPWSFARWGLEIVGLMSHGKKIVMFISVAVDYITKWVETESFATITATRVTRFIWTIVVCRYGIPRIIIAEKEKQFDYGHYKNWCRELGIKAEYIYSGHPQANGQVKATNKT